MKKIIVLEEDPSMSRLIETFIRRSVPQAIVVHKSTLTEIRSLLNSTENDADGYALAILDYTVNDGFSTEIIREIRDRYPGCKICMHSGLIPHDQEAMQHMTRHNPDFFLAKPSPSPFQDYRKVLEQAGIVS